MYIIRYTCLYTYKYTSIHIHTVYVVMLYSAIFTQITRILYLF